MDLDFLSTEFLSKIQVSKWGVTDISGSQSFNEYKLWLDQDLNGPLSYLEGKRAHLREDIKSFFPEFQSAIVFLFSYAKTSYDLEKFYKESPESNGLKVASYSLGFEGNDYHYYIREKLDLIKDKLIEKNPEMKIKYAMDVHPVLDRDLAFRAGLGWYGKNSMLINQKEGSFFIIASILVSQKLVSDQNFDLETDHCGKCIRCVDLCPTNAILPNTRTIDASLCLSTFTIEMFNDRKLQPPKGMELDSGEIFGCDICQTVCPWNQKKLYRGLELQKESSCEKNEKSQFLMDFFLKSSPNILIKKLEQMSNREYLRVFKGTSFERTGRVGILKNLYVYFKNLKGL